MSDADAIERGRALLTRVQDEDRTPTDRERDLAEIETLLHDATLPRPLSADLAVVRGAALGRLGRADEALAAVRDASARFADDEEPAVVQVVAFARLTEANLLVADGRLEEAATAGRGLMAMLLAHADGPAAAGIGTMGLDVAFWLLSGAADTDALEICATLIAALQDGDAAAAAVVAGARFFAAQASARLGRMDESREQIEALCEMGEPALAALNRIAAQFGAQETNPTWHAQIAATSVTVLWRLDRGEEAAELAGQAAGSFERLGMPELAEMLAELEREIAAR